MGKALRATEENKKVFEERRHLIEAENAKDNHGQLIRPVPTFRNTKAVLGRP
jgi:hypothetical protein